MSSEVSYATLLRFEETDTQTTPLIQQQANGGEQPESSFRKMTEAFFQP
jgi:hypothetical protein